MYDKAKITAGLLFFLALFGSPFWYGWTLGRSEQPSIVLSEEAKAVGKCIESVEYMKANHMDLLNTWRDKVVREGFRNYTAGDGSTYKMSLSNTCLACHTNRADFCDRCHNFEAVTPTCWNCHVNPGDYRR